MKIYLNNFKKTKTVTIFVKNWIFVFKWLNSRRSFGKLMIKKWSLAKIVENIIKFGNQWKVKEIQNVGVVFTFSIQWFEEKNIFYTENNIFVRKNFVLAFLMKKYC